MKAQEIVYRDPRDLQPYERNARTHPREQIEQIKASIRAYGWGQPVLLRDNDITIGVGHGRQTAAIEMLADGERLPTPDGVTIPTITLYGLTDAQWRGLVIADNKIALNSSWDEGILRLELAEIQSLGGDLSLTGFAPLELGALGLPGFAAEAEKAAEPRVSLMDRFGVAPFSVLNAREGWWQDRKRAWLALGIRSEVGRGENLLAMSETMLEPDPDKRAAKKARAHPGQGGGGGIWKGGKDDPKMANGRRPAATFGQDLMRGEHVVGREAVAAQQAGGLLMSAASAHPRYYEQKTAAEKRLSRKLENEEFERDHWNPPADSPASTGTSIFDPVLTELAYRWFCPPGGAVLDPFAGGSVRGIVAAKLGRSYVGVDLRQEQVDANRAQAEAILGAGDGRADWICADSRTLDALTLGPADFLFSCPPYADLEVYSDDPRDLSTLEYHQFRDAYCEIITKAAALLKPDRFACFVVGDVRDPKGNYRGFVRDTELAFESAGLRFYNEAILITAAGSLALRAGRQFETTRKLGKSHQNCLVFVKGDPRKATQAIGTVEFGAIDDEPAPSESKEGQDRDDREFGEPL